MIADAEKLIAFLPPTPDQTDAGAKVIYDLFGRQFDPYWLHYGLKEGFYKATAITVGDVPTFVLWYHVDLQGGLMINAASSIVATPLPEVLAAACELLAVRLGCNCVEFQTTRPGMIRQATRFGYVTTGIGMTKKLK
jgi:hypothetical protein